MENAGWIALLIVGIILAIVIGLYNFSGGGENAVNEKDIYRFSRDEEDDVNKKDINKKDINKKDTNNIRLRYEDYTQAEARYIRIALQNGCEFDRLYSLQQAGYGPKYIVMYVKLWELRYYVATKSWYKLKMNFDYDQSILEEQIFECVWSWCVSKGYLVAQYRTPSNGGTSMLMYENKL